MVGLGFGDLFVQSANRLAIISGCDRRYRGFERTSFLDASGSHVFEKLRSDFGLFNEIENGVSLGLVDCSLVSVVIIPDNDDIEDIAGDVAAEVRICAPDTLHAR